MPFTFIQHLLENEPPQRPTFMTAEEKNQLMQLMSKMFVVSQSTDIDSQDIYDTAMKLAALLEQIPDENGEFGAGEYAEETEANVTAMHDRHQHAKNRMDEPHAPASLKRQRQKANRHSKSQWGVGHDKGALTL